MRGIALALFVMATLPMAFVRPFAGLMLWIWFSYMNPHRITYGFANHFPWVFIVAAVTLFSLVIHHDQRQPFPKKTVSILLFVFLVWTGITTLFAVKDTLATAQWIIFLKIQLMVFATLILVTDERKLRWLLWVIVLSFGFWGLKGGVFTILKGGHYHVYGPAHSFFGDNNDFAMVLCMTLPLMRYLQLREPRRWRRIALWILMLSSVVAILGTYSRGGLLALAVVLLMIFLKGRRRFALTAVLVATITAAFNFMPSQWVQRMHTIETVQQTATDSESARGRLQSWVFATKVALARPLTGGGFRVWASNRMWDEYGPVGSVHRAIHDIFFEVLAEHGFVGLGLFLALIISGWKSLRRTKRLARAGPEPLWASDLADMLQASLVGFLAAGSLLPMSYLDFFYQLLALCALLEVFAERIVVSSAASNSAVPRLGPVPLGSTGDAREANAVGFSSRSGEAEWRG